MLPNVSSLSTCMSVVKRHMEKTFQMWIWLAKSMITHRESVETLHATPLPISTIIQMKGC